MRRNWPHLAAQLLLFLLLASFLALPAHGEIYSHRKIHRRGLDRVLLQTGSCQTQQCPSQSTSRNLFFVFMPRYLGHH